MSEPPSIRWLNLLSLSATTFSGAEVPPYGLTTRLLARVREESQQREQIERIGLQALFLSLALLLLTGAVTLVMDYHDQPDLEPGVKSIVQVDEVQDS